MTLEEFKAIVRKHTRLPLAKLDAYAEEAYKNPCFEEWLWDGEVPQIVALHDLHTITFQTGNRLWEAREKVLEKMPMDKAKIFIENKLNDFLERVNLQKKNLL